MPKILQIWKTFNTVLPRLTQPHPDIYTNPDLPRFPRFWNIDTAVSFLKIDTPVSFFEKKLSGTAWSEYVTNQFQRDD